MSQSIALKLGNNLGSAGQMIAERDFRQEKLAKKKQEYAANQTDSLTPVNFRDIPTENNQEKNIKNNLISSKEQQQAATKLNKNKRELKNNKKTDVKGKVDKTIDAMTAPVNQATSRLLQQSWMSMFYTGGISAIFSVLWINIHVFLRWVFGEKLFCKLGHEWIPQQANAISGGQAEKVSKSIGLIEVMGLVMIDFFLLAIIIFILGLLAIIIGLLAQWQDANIFGKAWIMGKAIWNLGLDAFSGLGLLFKL